MRVSYFLSKKKASKISFHEKAGHSVLNKRKSIEKSGFLILSHIQVSKIMIMVKVVCLFPIVLKSTSNLLVEFSQG